MLHRKTVGPLTVHKEEAPWYEGECKIDLMESALGGASDPGLDSRAFLMIKTALLSGYKGFGAASSLFIVFCLCGNSHTQVAHIVPGASSVQLGLEANPESFSPLSTMPHHEEARAGGDSLCGQLSTCSPPCRRGHCFGPGLVPFIPSQ